MRREINVLMHVQEEEQQAAGVDLAGLRTDLGLHTTHVS
jgi:hypothetical protein